MLRYLLALLKVIGVFILILPIISLFVVSFVFFGAEPHADPRAGHDSQHL